MTVGPADLARGYTQPRFQDNATQLVGVRLLSTHMSFVTGGFTCLLSSSAAPFCDNKCYCAHYYDISNSQGAAQQVG